MADQTLVVDLETLTINDIIDFEEISKVSFDRFITSVGKDDAFTTAEMMIVFRAMRYVVGRRDNPDLTLIEAGNVPLSQLGKVEVRGDKLDPTDGGEQNTSA